MNTYDPTAALERVATKYYAHEEAISGFRLVEPDIKTELLLAYKKGREDAVEYLLSKNKSVSFCLVDFDVLDAALQSGEGDPLS